ncbi:uncharacterized protein LOC111280112 isoform X2 [Durio zibethinus]|uniref:Uncharacterized protein LOC111280112 isoform X2 n=1 Tax=Durio zibethinus TaxID=66656 RepID=A0A6P5X5R4_DURZI|nr:uncharacterized protein LOC111280112 isoform X2 [Durio zibethinus]
MKNFTFPKTPTLRNRWKSDIVTGELNHHPPFCPPDSSVNSTAINGGFKLAPGLYYIKMLPLHRTVRSDLCGLSKAAFVTSLPFCSLKNMNPAKKPAPRPAGFPSITAGKHFGSVSSAKEARQSYGATSINEKKSQSSYEKEFPSRTVKLGSSSRGWNSNKSRTRFDSGSKVRQETFESFELEETANIASLREEQSFPSHFGKDNVVASHVQKSPSGQSKSKNVASTKNSDYSEGNRSSSRIDSGVEPRHETLNLSELEGIVNIASLQEEHSLLYHIGKKVKTGHVQKSPSGQSKSNNVLGTQNSDCSEDLHKVKRFNICLPRSRDFETREILRPGMVLLKRYISLREQINMVKTCQTLGEGPGGFYRPGFKDGAKLSLHMMCLGLNWDPQNRKYDKRHPLDDCEAPNIPHEFRLLVQRAIQDAHYLIKKDSGIVNPEDVLPSMSPNICIVNFYTRYGKLGLHQDRDESRESLHKGLPVVSLSVGDSAEFLYGDRRDVDQAEKVLLDSGDVLIFGGESRMVFHGVRSIIPFSAPEALLAETGLRRGRLNLTFRQF